MKFLPPQKISQVLKLSRYFTNDTGGLTQSKGKSSVIIYWGWNSINENKVLGVLLIIWNIYIAPANLTLTDSIYVLSPLICNLMVSNTWLIRYVLYRSTISRIRQHLEVFKDCQIILKIYSMRQYLCEKGYYHLAYCLGRYSADIYLLKVNKRNTRTRC